ncbi:MAG: VWA domain-containing protein [Thermoflexales bacterium]|nr:VWA domain-containing protein [Thermoflexales bacterium]
MKHHIKYIGMVSLVVALLLGQTAAAQGTVTVKLDSVDMSRFPQLTAYATVIDENGLPITELTADRFELVEDGQASFPPQAAQTITNDKAAMSVLVLIDLSETMRGKPLESAKAATANFLEKLLNEGNDPDQAAFVGFGRSVDIKQTDFDDTREVPFTNDRGRLLNVVNFVEVDRNAGTPLYDAIYRAVKITAQQSGRRAIIVMTDGSDVSSTLKQDDPINEARRQHIPIFPIGLSNSRLDKVYLARLAELTGGQFQEAPTPDELEQKFVDVLNQLKVQYVLTYQSRLPEADGQYHSLLLRVNTARGQSFDEIKFQFGQLTPAPAATPKPGETSVAPLPLATPAPTETKIVQLDEIINWVRQNTLLAGGILAAALLLLIMLIAFVVLLMRRRSTDERGAWEAAQAEWPASPMDYPHKSDGVDYSAIPTSAVPTVSPAAPPTTPGTQVAPPIVPAVPGPFAPPPPPPKQAAPEATPTGAGGTMLIQRGPKIKVMGILVDRKQSSRRYDVDKPTVTVGRAPGNTIVLDHATVSRQHATIKLEKDEFRLHDLGSANGTFVDDKRVREPLTLEDGAIVRFGEQEFTFKRVSLE